MSIPFCSFLILVTCIISISSAQTVLSDFDRVSAVSITEVERNIRPDVLQGEWKSATRSEFRLLMHLMIRSYQVFISAQDKPTCSFHPGCSAYGQLALKQAGIAKGLLLTSDRLQRCHGFPSSLHNYPFNWKTGRLEDPLENYLDLETVSSDKEGSN